jgi:UDP-N-acetylmuramate--alanine ligase
LRDTVTHKGAHVTGSDGSPSKIVDDLIKESFVVHVGHDAQNVEEGVDLVIYSIAVKDTNPELRAAREKGITCMTYPEALGLLTQEYTTIAVCGTHGKTTTTAMLASMFKALGKSPTVIVGSLLSDGGTNFIQGESEYLIVEACEYKRSFLNYNPTHIVVTNIDADHLDYYKDLDDIKKAFQEFIDKLPENGTLITHADVSLITQAKK